MAVTFIFVAAAAAIFDLRKGIIPNRLAFSGLGIGAVFRIILDIMDGIPSDILVMALEVIILFFCLLPVYRIGGLGAGDCKLLLIAGVFLPVKQAVFVIISTFFIAAAESVVLIVVYWIKKEKKKIETIHFAPSFLLAVLYYQYGRIF